MRYRDSPGVAVIGVHECIVNASEAIAIISVSTLSSDDLRQDNSRRQNLLCTPGVLPLLESGFTVTTIHTKNNKWLKNDRLFTASRRSKNAAVRRYFSPSKHT